MAIRKAPDGGTQDLHAIFEYARSFDGYAYATEHLGRQCGDLANEQRAGFEDSGAWSGTFEELRCCLFFEQRRWRHFGEIPDGTDADAIRALFRSICEAWDKDSSSRR